jgi:lysozyme
MLQLIVTANKLNKRNNIPAKLPEPNGIVGTVNKGFSFEGTEFLPVPNPALGKWYQDRDGSFYWGGGVIVETASTKIELPGLPVNLPENFRLGVDVSHHNENLDWDGIKNAGASFVFIKITDGVGTRDKQAKVNADNAKQKGLRIGYYHFCHPDTKMGGSVENDATAEANEALKVMAGLQKNDLPLVLDLETGLGGVDSPLSQANYLLWVTTFIERIKTVSGADIIIYGNRPYLNSKLPTGHDLGKHKLWLAAYPAKPDCDKTDCPIGWKDWAIWQYTEDGVIGKNPKLDINILKDPTLF